MQLVEHDGVIRVEPPVLLVVAELVRPDRSVVEEVVATWNDLIVITGAALVSEIVHLVVVDLTDFIFLLARAPNVKELREINVIIVIVEVLGEQRLALMTRHDILNLDHLRLWHVASENFWLDSFRPRWFLLLDHESLVSDGLDVRELSLFDAFL